MYLLFGISLILTSIIPTLTFAYTPKEGNVSAILGPIIQKTNFTQKKTAPASTNNGGTAIMLIGDISEVGSLELGFFHTNKSYFRERDEKYLVEKTQLMHITMGYRRWVTPYLSGSLTFSSGYTMGDAQTVHTDFTNSNQPDTSATDKTEYGLDLALQYEVWSSGRYGIELAGFYSKSLTNKPDESGDHYGVLMGLRYFIQEKQRQTGPAP